MLKQLSPTFGELQKLTKQLKNFNLSLQKMVLIQIADGWIS